jgi:hypothetical protein
MTGIDKPMNHDGWLQRIGASRFLDPASRWQAGRILRDTPPNKRSVAIFCPTKSFRKLFGTIPEDLEARGIHVIRLYCERHLDDYENHPSAYRVWGKILDYLGFIDLFMVPTIMDSLPDESRKMLMVHGSFGGIPFPTGKPAEPEANVSSPLSDAELVTKHTHMTAYWRLYDYISVATPEFVQSCEHAFQMYQQPAVTHPFTIDRCANEQTLREHTRLADRLKPKRLAQSQCVIPLGYPSLDEGMHRTDAHTQSRESITYAPTPVVGKEHWKPFVSIHSHGPDIMEALLRAFPERPIVFKPYADEQPETILPILEIGSHYPNFVHDQSGGNYHDCYAKTAVMVSDFSSAAYTFSLANQQPTIFFSHNEANLPDSVKQCAFACFRNEVGKVATDCEELVQAVRHALDHPELYREKILNTREQAVFNPGRSAGYFADNIYHILNDAPHPDWQYYGTLPTPRGSHGNLEGDATHWQQRTQHHMHLGNAALERSLAFLAPSTATTARDELQQGFSESPDHEGVVSALGQLEMLLGRHAESISLLFLAVELNPWDVGNHNRLAEAFDNLHMDGEAEAHRQSARHLQGNGHNLKYDSPAQTNQLQTA